MSRACHGAWVLVWIVTTAVSCIYDGDDRCGPNMALSEIESCDCVAGFVLVGSECVACGEHETENNGACTCDAGYQRPSESAACVETPKSGDGAACSDTQPCLDDEFAYCAEASNGDRYCTRAGCTVDGDCQLGHACALGTDAAYCQRYPLGLTSPCESDAECAGTEATYCETLISQSCLVQGCSLSQNDCFTGWECCDVSAYGMATPICVPEGDCPT